MKYIIYYRIDCFHRYNFENIANGLLLSRLAVILLISSYAYFLVFHGSRDCRTQTAALNLRNLLIAREQPKNILTQHNYLGKNPEKIELKSTTFAASFSTPPIEIAALELTDLPLSESLINFAQQAKTKGFKRIKVIPLFLAPGVHVQTDIPSEIATAAKQIDDRVTIELSPYLGKYSEIVTLLTQQFEELDERPRVAERRKGTLELRAKTRILIAHGSRLLAVAEYYQELGNQLDADVAYWSTKPRFSEQIRLKIAAGSQKIALLPYFLFPGRITEAIAKEIAELQQEYPQVDLRLGKPLGELPEIAELIAQSA